VPSGSVKRPRHYRRTRRGRGRGRQSALARLGARLISRPRSRAIPISRSLELEARRAFKIRDLLGAIAGLSASQPARPRERHPAAPSFTAGYTPVVGPRRSAHNDTTITSLRRPDSVSQRDLVGRTPVGANPAAAPSATAARRVELTCGLARWLEDLRPSGSCRPRRADPGRARRWRRALERARPVLGLRTPFTVGHLTASCASTHARCPSLHQLLGRRSGRPAGSSTRATRRLAYDRAARLSANPVGGVASRRWGRVASIRLAPRSRSQLGATVASARRRDRPSIWRRFGAARRLRRRRSGARRGTLRGHLGRPELEIDSPARAAVGAHPIERTDVAAGLRDDAGTGAARASPRCRSPAATPPPVARAGGLAHTPVPAWCAGIRQPRPATGADRLAAGAAGPAHAQRRAKLRSPRSRSPRQVEVARRRSTERSRSRALAAPSSAADPG